jgi:hypothetical protein
MHLARQDLDMGWWHPFGHQQIAPDVDVSRVSLETAGPMLALTIVAQQDEGCDTGVIQGCGVQDPLFIHRST